MWPPGRTGANPTPQLPVTTVVVPWLADGSSRSSQVACPFVGVLDVDETRGVTIAPAASDGCAAPTRRGRDRPRDRVLPRPRLRPKDGGAGPVHHSVVPDQLESSLHGHALFSHSPESPSRRRAAQRATSVALKRQSDKEAPYNRQRRNAKAVTPRGWAIGITLRQRKPACACTISSTARGSP